MGAAEKPKDFKKTWGRLIQYCKSYLPAILAALIIAALGTVFQIIGPDKLKDMANEIAKGLPGLVNGQPVLGAIDFQAVTGIATLLVFLYASSGLFSLTENYTQQYAAMLLDCSNTLAATEKTMQSIREHIEE